MYNELTQQDIAIMEQELQEKRLVELPAAIEEEPSATCRKTMNIKPPSRCRTH